MQWLCLSFEQLSPLHLYRILQLRSGWQEDTLVAYTRLLPPGVSYTEASIGRVVTSPAYRRTGSGKLLMQESILRCTQLFGKGPIRIGAQLYLKKFYEGFDFIANSDVYLEDNIEHIEMIRP